MFRGGDGKAYCDHCIKTGRACRDTVLKGDLYRTQNRLVFGLDELKRVVSDRGKDR